VIKALLIIGLVVAFMVGGLLGLRRTTRTGMPSAEVLERARRRTIDQDAADKQDPEA